MKRRDIANILFTFIVGLVAGVYLYFWGFAPTVNKVETVVEEVGVTLTVTAEAYGGCDRTDSCPSFYIADTGSYRFFYTPRVNAEQVRREGALPLAMQRDLKRYATESALTSYSQPTSPAMCNSFADGIDVEYRIELEGELYVLDSCGTDVNPNGLLWQTLSSIWDYFETSGL